MKDGERERVNERGKEKRSETEAGLILTSTRDPVDRKIFTVLRCSLITRSLETRPLAGSPLRSSNERFRFYRVHTYTYIYVAVCAFT